MLKQTEDKCTVHHLHSDHRAGAVVDIVTEYEVQLGSLQIQMKFYLEKMKLR